MAGPPKVGATARLKDGTIVRWSGTAWVQAQAAPAPQFKEDRQALNQLNEQSQAARDNQRFINEAQAASKRLPTGPFRGALYDLALPEEKGGLLDGLAATFIGGPLRITGALTEQNVQDIQTMDRAKQAAVLAEQRTQKGVQTEGDAVRMAMVGLDKRKTNQNNVDVTNSATARNNEVLTRAQFFTQWANRYGLNRLNERGQSVEQAFEEHSRQPKPAAPAKASNGFKIVR